MKKVILFLLVLIFSFSVYGQQKRKWRGNYLISGFIENVSTGKAILTYDDISRKGVEQKVKEAAIANGKFAFSDYLEEPALVQLTINNEKYTFYIDPATMEVNINKDNTIEVKGSWTNDDKIKIEQLEERINSMAEGKTNPNGNLAELSFASIENNSFVILKKMQAVAEPTHPLHSDIRTRQMIGILMSMPDEIKNTPSGIKTSERLFLLSVKMHAPQQK